MKIGQMYKGTAVKEKNKMREQKNNQGGERDGWVKVLGEELEEKG